MTELGLLLEKALDLVSGLLVLGGVIPVRLDPELGHALRERAAADHSKASAVIREPCFCPPGPVTLALSDSTAWPDVLTVHSGRSFEFTTAQLTEPSQGALHALSEGRDYESFTLVQLGDDP